MIQAQTSEMMHTEKFDKAEGVENGLVGLGFCFSFGAFFWFCFGDFLVCFLFFLNQSLLTSCPTNKFIGFLVNSALRQLLGWRFDFCHSCGPQNTIFVWCFLIFLFSYKNTTELLHLLPHDSVVSPLM